MITTLKRTSVLLLLCMVTGLHGRAQNPAGHSGINVVMLGDSNTWIGGDRCDRPRGWNKWFRDAFAPASCRSYARSGATWTNTARTTYNVKDSTDLLGDDNVIYNQVNRLLLDVREGRQDVPDLIMISAGTNDAWFRKKARPEAFGRTVSWTFADGNRKCATPRHNGITDKAAGEVLTLAESVRYCCEMLQEAFPKARMVLLTPLQSTAVSTADIRRTGDIIEGCAQHMGLSVIRQDGTGYVSREQELRQKHMTTDGTHTSEEGARLNGTRIAETVKRIMASSYDAH